MFVLLNFYTLCKVYGVLLDSSKTEGTNQRSLFSDLSLEDYSLVFDRYFDHWNFIFNQLAPISVLALAPPVLRGCFRLWSWLNLMAFFCKFSAVIDPEKSAAFCLFTCTRSDRERAFISRTDILIVSRQQIGPLVLFTRESTCRAALGAPPLTWVSLLTNAPRLIH